MLEKPLQSTVCFINEAVKYSDIRLTNNLVTKIALFITATSLLSLFKITNISRFYIGKVTAGAFYAALSRSASIFSKLFFGAIKLLFVKYEIKELAIAIDDTDRERSKNCKILPYVKKAICKATGGWIQAQNIVFIVLVTDKITIPIWFCFHRPANLTKEQKKQCRRNSKKTKEFDPKYRTKTDLACIGLFVVSRMLKTIEAQLGININVSCILGDNGYACPKVQIAANKYFETQYISKANPDQKVMSRGKEHSLSSFFERFKSQSKTIELRSGKLNVEYKAARVFVKRYQRKVLVVAIRYDANSPWQYLFGTDISWTAKSIIQAYSLRWLVEVFFEDWKQYDGWGEGALQRSNEGAVRGVFLSLLTDLFLLYHQRTNPSLQRPGRIELYSAGTVVRHLQAEAIREAIEAVLEDDNPRHRLKSMYKSLIAVAEKRVSLKHGRYDRLSNDLRPSMSLKKIYGVENRCELEKQARAYRKCD